MKGFILTTLTLMSLSSFANTRHEFDENIEKLCHQQLKQLQCLTADEKESGSCIEAKWSQVSLVCQKMYKIKKTQGSQAQ